MSWHQEKQRERYKKRDCILSLPGKAGRWSGGRKADEGSDQGWKIEAELSPTFILHNPEKKEHPEGTDRT
jgi:hypothetical protein